ncbi:hypothetical protein U1872_02905 [Sphingomonas sp. RB3P16]|uniref:hypothetical protein n=1 Tax=Parasphingomonas frigoris TaxID=3096163 RepID=UPI002FCBB5B5
MPNLDAGHYFFTALVPVCNEGIVAHEPVAGSAHTMKSSPIHLVRETLETLPTALQSHATEAIGIQSPFARSLRTHFARFLVLDRPHYNGRDPENAILESLANTDLLAPQPQDSLSCPYIVVMIDFDPVVPDGAGEPRAYVEELWGLMSVELSAVFRYCYGFGAVHDAKSFADFLLPCQIETVMPFNDYWTGPPPLKSLSIIALAVPPVAGLVLPLIAHFAFGWSSLWGSVLVALALLIVGVLLSYAFVMWKGRQPFPGNPDATLPHVLKGLYLQQAFTRFVTAHQADTREARGAAFREFLVRHRPADLVAPTQPPGVIRSPFAEDGA